MFTIKLKGFDEAIKDLSEKKFAVMKVAAMAINKAATHARAQMVKMGREDYTMPAKELRDSIQIEKANMRWLQAKLTVSDRTIPLIKFKTKGTGRPRGIAIKAASKTKVRRGRKTIPVQAMVKKSGGFKIIPNAFKAKGRYGVSLFVRKTKKRGPLKMLSGPSVAGIVRSSSNFNKIIQSTERTLQREFEQGLDHALNKGRVAEGELS